MFCDEKERLACFSSGENRNFRELKNKTYDFLEKYDTILLEYV